MITIAAQRKFARLSFTDGEVVVSPRDQGASLNNAEKAAEACRNAVQSDRRVEQFQGDLLKPLHDWCMANSGRIRACYLQVPGSQVQVFVVTNSRRFDFDFAEKLAALELQFARVGWRISILQLPEVDEDSLGAFVNPEGALEVYADCGSAPD